MPMKNPPHPGRSIEDACLDPLGLSVTEGAKALGVARHTLSRVLNGQAGISAEMAIRLEKAGWSNADHWLRLQTATMWPRPASIKTPDQSETLRTPSGL
ncbi:MAG: HigA family addiction module antidote protein [Acidobacteriia bacterium]|nr:HigA family addiction module antidote protein [Terriglobia bacterium]